MYFGLKVHVIVKEDLMTNLLLKQHPHFQYRPADICGNKNVARNHAMPRIDFILPTTRAAMALLESMEVSDMAHWQILLLLQLT